MIGFKAPPTVPVAVPVPGVRVEAVVPPEEEEELELELEVVAGVRVVGIVTAAGAPVPDGVRVELPLVDAPDGIV